MTVLSTRWILIQLSFELAAKLGFKEAAKAAKAVLMEPIMKLEVLTPEENMGDIVGDLTVEEVKLTIWVIEQGLKLVKAECSTYLKCLDT